MATPARSLLLLRDQVDLAWPNRSHLSDGILGDPAHRRRRSDHNSGNAIDITHDLGVGLDTFQLGDELRRQMASYPAGRLSLLISQGYLAGPRTDWRWVRYTGPNPHRTHLHASIRASARGIMRPWRLR